MADRLTGGQILARALSALGARDIFCVAGESYLPFLDAAVDHPEFNVMTCRHESGAGFMAEAQGKLTGKPGIAFVTRGPGVCNASIAIHTAKQDSTPLLVFMGQVRRWERGREAFQEVDVRAVFGTLAKWATEIDDPAEIPQIVEEAWIKAVSGRPGPVVIGLPEDMLSEEIELDLPEVKIDIPKPTIQNDDLQKMIAALSEAQKPLVILGGAGWTEEGLKDFESFIEKSNLPVCVSLRRNDLFDHRNDHYIGDLGFGPNPKLIERVKEADVIVAFGARLNEITTQGYTLLGDEKRPSAKLIHIHADETEIGKVYTPDIGLHADTNEAAKLLGAQEIKGNWESWSQEARQDFEAWGTIDPAKLYDWNGADLTAIYQFLQTALPEESIVTTDAGNFAVWALRYLKYGRPGRFLAPISGAMGYAVPSAISAALTNPGKLVLGLCGDGGFMMTGNEIATAIHHGAKPIIMVCNNGMYGTIRMHQEKHFPGRKSATDLTNPDFVAYAQSFGAFAARVEDAKDFESVWKEARASGKCAVIEVIMDPRQITTQADPLSSPI